MRGPWPIEVGTQGAAVAGTVLWRHAGRSTLTIVVKASFSLEEGTARLTAPADLVLDERFLPQSRSLASDVDIAPYKPRAEVTFVGSAWATSATPQVMTRLAIQGTSPLFDRPLLVVGDRHAPGAAPRPFQSMPIVWDRTWAEPTFNPAGVPPGSGRAPNILDPTNEGAPASYGPISRTWGARSRVLGRGDPRLTQGTRPEMPNELSWGLFLAAPVDQQVSRLQGDEVIILEHLIEGAPRLRVQLPGARAVARYHGPNAPADGAAIAMRLDTLGINGYERRVHLLWRGTMAFPNDAAAPASRVVAGLEMPAGAGAFAPQAAAAQPSPATVRMTTRGLGPPPGLVPPPPAPPPPAPPLGPPAPFVRDSGTMPVGRPLINVPKINDDPPLYDLDDDDDAPESTAGSTMAIDPEAAMKMLAGRAGATPWERGAPPAPPPPAPPPPAPPPPAPPAPVAPAPPARVPSPAAAAGPGPIVVRPAGADDIDDDDSVGSTMAISPEAAAALMARRAPPPDPPAPTAPATQRPARSKAPTIPIPAPPPPIPPAVVPPPPRSPEIGPDGRHGTIEMEPVPDSEAGGGTMVLQVPDDVARRGRR